jgi:hypothetical protein
MIFLADENYLFNKSCGKYNKLTMTFFVLIHKRKKKYFSVNSFANQHNVGERNDKIIVREKLIGNLRQLLNQSKNEFSIFNFHFIG